MRPRSTKDETMCCDYSTTFSCFSAIDFSLEFISETYTQQYSDSHVNVIFQVPKLDK